MRKISNRLFLLFVLMSFAFGIFGLTGCTSEESKNGLKLSFEQKVYEVEIGEQIQISPIIKNADNTEVYLVWKTYNSSVVLVNDGVLEGVGVGKTDVKVYVSGQTNISATVTIKVTGKEQKPVAKFNDVPETLYVGDTLELTYELANPEAECEFVFQSLTDAATVNERGLIEVVKEGYGLITVKVTDKTTGQYVNYNFAFEVLTNYDIIYENVEDANNDVNPNFYISEQKDVVLKEPTRFGWKFLGWYEDPNFGREISVIDVDRKEDVTVYAKWETIYYNIIYNTNGGKLPTYNVIDEYQPGFEIELARPRLEGYKFEGWYEDPKFEGEPVLKLSATEEGHKEYYAKWVEAVTIVANEFDTSKVYKLGIYQENLKQTLFVTGAMSGYYGASTKKPVDAADVQVIEVENGYNLKLILANGNVKYINLVVSGEHINISFDNAPTSVWVYNSQYNTFITTVNSTGYFLGTYNTYNTFSPSKESYLTSNFIAHLYEEVELTDELEAELALKDVELVEELDSDYKLPVIDNVVWEVLDGKGVVELENGVLVVTRPEAGEEDVTITVTAKYEIAGEVIATKDFEIIILAEEEISEQLTLYASYDFGTSQSTGFSNNRNISIKEGVSGSNKTVIFHQAQITTSGNSPHSSAKAFAVLCPTRKNNSTKNSYIQFSFTEAVKQIKFDLTWWSSSDKGSHSSKVSKFEVQYSSDGNTWTSVNLGSVSNIDATKYTEITVDLVNAKYVRIYLASNSTYSSNQNARIAVDNVKIYK